MFILVNEIMDATLYLLSEHPLFPAGGKKNGKGKGNEKDRSERMRGRESIESSMKLRPGHNTKPGTTLCTDVSRSCER